MPTHRQEIPPGTLDMLILKVLTRGTRLHGFEIANSIHAISESVLQVEEGSLYPALQRMLAKGWIEGEWDKTPENRRARYYSVTRLGRKQLEAEMDRYRQVSIAIGRILQQA